MTTFVRERLVYLRLPRDGSRGTLNGQDEKPMSSRYGQIIMRARSSTKTGRQLFTYWLGGSDEEAVAGDDWCRVPQARKWYLPADVLLFTPFLRGIGRW